jgi:hypothetical protein
MVTLHESGRVGQVMRDREMIAHVSYGKGVMLYGRW